jgi:hypothetical protein
MGDGRIVLPFPNDAGLAYLPENGKTWQGNTQAIKYGGALGGYSMQISM